MGLLLPPSGRLSGLSYLVFVVVVVVSFVLVVAMIFLLIGLVRLRLAVLILFVSAITFKLNGRHSFILWRAGLVRYITMGQPSRVD